MPAHVHPETDEICIADLATTIHRLSGSKSPLRLKFIPYDEIGGRRYEDVRRRVPDVNKAGRLLGFEAKVGLEEGLKRTIEWQRAISEAEVALAGTR